jgi:hypothetical protein
MRADGTRSKMLEGTRLGAYEVGAWIGDGSVASVFEGKHVELGKSVAIKVLADRLAQSGPARARFLASGRAAATLEHPNAALILDVGVQGEAAFLVIEIVRGDTLAHRLRDGARLPLPDALALLLPVASALAYAHDRGLSHGHLSAREIFLPQDRHGDVYPKLVDFGVFAAAIEGGAGASPAADRRALALTLCEALAGVAPSAPGDQAAILLDQAVPAGLDDVLRRGLSADAADSFSDVRAFARALLPFAPVEVAQAWERDFEEVRPSGVEPPTSRRSSKPTDETLVGSTRSVPADSKLPFRAGTSAFHIKGIAYRGVVRLVERRLPGGFEALAREVGDPEIAAFLRQPFLVASRYDILPILPINAAIARLMGKPLAALATEQGIAQACHDVQYVYRRMFEAMSLETLHTYVPRLGDQYFDFGECSAERIGPGALVVHRRRLPEYVLPWFAPAHAAYLEEVVRWKGAGTVQATLRPPLAAASRRGLAMVDLDTEVRWR